MRLITLVVSLLFAVAPGCQAQPAAGEAAGPPAAQASEAPVQTVGKAGTLLVVSRGDRAVDFVDAGTGRKLASLPVGEGSKEVAISPDGRTAIVSHYGSTTHGNTLHVIDVASAAEIRRIDLGDYKRPNGMAFLPGGTRVAVTSQLSIRGEEPLDATERLIIVDVESGKIESVWPTGMKVCHKVLIAPDGERAYVANMMSSTVTVFDLKDGTILGAPVTGHVLEGIALTPDAAQIWTANRTANTLSVIDTGKLAVLHTVPCGEYPVRIHITPDGAHSLVSCAKSGDIVVFDTSERKEVKRLNARNDKPLEPAGQVGDSPMPGCIATDGERAFVTSLRNAEVLVIDLKTLEITARWPVGAGPDGVAWSPVACEKKPIETGAEPATGTDAAPATQEKPAPTPPGQPE